MRNTWFLLCMGLLLLAPLTAVAEHHEICEGFGPQTPRDISSKVGENSVSFSFAPPSEEMNLCNIHFHKQAEHKGPGFSEFAGEGTYGGYRCNGSEAQEAKDGKKGTVCENVNIGDTIEVHWVYSSCQVKPGESLKACSSKACANPQLRVETQVFLVVGGDKGKDFGKFSNNPDPVNGRYQPLALPSGTGKPVAFLGSTTGPDFDSDLKCSPLQVTWSVRPQCAEVNMKSLGEWCADDDNVFKEKKAHGVRALVTDPRLLSEIP